MTGNIEAFTLGDLEERMPKALDAVLCHEFNPDSKQLVMVLNYATVHQGQRIAPIENYLLIAAANECIQQCPYIEIDMFRPALDQAAMAAAEMYRVTSTAMGEALNNDRVRLHPYTPQSDRRSIFIRDLVHIAQNLQGNELLISSPIAHSDATLFALAYAINRDLKIPVRQLPIHSVGGNIIVTDNFVLTLQDMLRLNGIIKGLSKPVMESIPTKFGNVSLGKPIAILDFNRLDENAQTIFHLDMLLNVVRGSDGAEYFLLADPTLAKSLLEERKYLGGKSFNSGSWRSENGYPSYTAKNITKFTENIIQAMVKSSGKHLMPKEVQILVDNFIHYFGFPGYAHQTIGSNLDQFFFPGNMDVTTAYIQEIQHVLIQLGVPQDHIISIPTLVFHDSFIDHNFSTVNPKITIISQRKVPMISPVNGLQMSNPITGSTDFISPGGIRIFDEYITKVLAKIGIRHVPLPSAIGLGFSASGFRCVSVAR